MRQVNSSRENGLKFGGLVLPQRLSLVAIASSFIFCGAAKAQAQLVHTQAVEVCDAQILTGGYGYSFSGFSGPFTVAQPFFGEGRVGAVGLATFNGAEGLIVRDTLARSGTPAIRHAGSGRYSVNANCTGHGSIDLTSDTPIDLEHLEFDFMIVPGTHGREFSFIVTNQTLCAVGDPNYPNCDPKLPEQTGVALSIETRHAVTPACKVSIASLAPGLTLITRSNRSPTLTSASEPSMEPGSRRVGRTRDFRTAQSYR